MQDSYFDSRLYHIWSPPGRLFGAPGRLFGAPGRLFGVPGRPWGDPGETHNVVAMAQKGSIVTFTEASEGLCESNFHRGLRRVW